MQSFWAFWVSWKLCVPLVWRTSDQTSGGQKRVIRKETAHLFWLQEYINWRQSASWSQPLAIDNLSAKTRVELWHKESTSDIARPKQEEAALQPYCYSCVCVSGTTSNTKRKTRRDGCRKVACFWSKSLVRTTYLSNLLNQPVTNGGLSRIWPLQGCCMVDWKW